MKYLIEEALAAFRARVAACGVGETLIVCRMHGPLGACPAAEDLPALPDSDSRLEIGQAVSLLP